MRSCYNKSQGGIALPFTSDRNAFHFSSPYSQKQRNTAVCYALSLTPHRVYIRVIGVGYHGIAPHRIHAMRSNILPNVVFLFFILSSYYWRTPNIALASSRCQIAYYFSGTRASPGKGFRWGGIQYNQVSCTFLIINATGA